MARRGVFPVKSQQKPFLVLLHKPSNKMCTSSGLGARGTHSLLPKSELMHGAWGIFCVHLPASLISESGNLGAGPPLLPPSCMLLAQIMEFGSLCFVVCKMRVLAKVIFKVLAFSEIP